VLLTLGAVAAELDQRQDTAALCNAHLRFLRGSRRLQEHTCRILALLWVAMLQRVDDAAK